MKTLTVANQKGGVGKSTTATQLAFYLSMLRFRVLVLDHDPQCHTTKPIIKSNRAAVMPYSSFDIFSGLKHIPGLDRSQSLYLVSADSRLSMMERNQKMHDQYLSNLHEFLSHCANNFDICIIDTNPNPDIRYIASLAVSTHCIAPMQLNQEALDGVNNMLNHANYGINNIKQKLNPKLKFVGILPSLVQGNPFQKENFIEVKSKLQKLLIPAQSDFIEYAYIPFTIAFAEAQQAGLMLREIKKSSAQKAWKVTKQSFDAIAKSIRLEI